MITKKRMKICLGILVIAVLICGFSLPSSADTMNYKVYSYVVKAEKVAVGDVEGHMIGSVQRNAFYVFDKGEVVTQTAVSTIDYINNSGPFLQYSTLTFEDGSTMIIKTQGMMGGTVQGQASTTGWKAEIIKGTGRFEGIKGTQTQRVKYLPLEKGEIQPKGYGEGTLTFTLPAK